MHVPSYESLHALVSSGPVIASFLLGALFAVSCKPLVRSALRVLGALLNGRLPSERDPRRGLYSLDHAKLNLSLPAGAMWMNMGYWKTAGLGSDGSDDDDASTEDFSTACPNLLAKVLESAGLLRSHVGGREGEKKAAAEEEDVVERRRRPIRLLDVGIGCGDQTRALLRLRGGSRDAAEAFPTLSDNYSARCSVESYVGLTKDPRQLAYARSMLRRHGDDLCRSESGGGPGRTTIPSETTGYQSRGTPVGDDRGPKRYKVFCADASRPEAWSDAIKTAVAGLKHRRIATAASPARTWLLGLDSLYHLAPSRLALFRYAHDELGASVAAFDLLLPAPRSQRLTFSQEALLRLVCLLTSTPRANLMDPDAYAAQLVRAGYGAADVSIEDVSEHVFAPLARFLDRRGRELRVLGLGLGAFRAAKWIFGWWAASGVVRGCIVVARHESHTDDGIGKKERRRG